MLYALALVPVGLLADRVHRPRLLAAGIVVWSLLTMAASRVRRKHAAHVLRQPAWPKSSTIQLRPCLSPDNVHQTARMHVAHSVKECSIPRKFS